MYADPKLNPALRWKASVSLDHAVLHFDGASDSIHNTAKLDNSSVASALNHTPVMHGDGRVNQIATERPQPCQRSIFAIASKPAVSDHVRSQDRYELAGLNPRHASRRSDISTKLA